MKAITLKNFGSADNFVVEEVEMPTNSENNVLVKIIAAAFNPIDYQMRKGATESKLLKSAILGRELSGTVTEVGANVKGISVGEEILAYIGSLGSNGTYAEFISIPQELIAQKPKNITFEQASAIALVGLTAMQCYERLKPLKENSVFIGGGAGGVGTMLIKLFIYNGNNQIITTAGNSQSKSHLMNLGVQERNIVDYRDTNFIKNILARNNNYHFDYCIDLVGGKISEVCSEVIKVNGYYADITNLATPNAKEQLFDKGITIVNISNYAYTLGEGANLSYYGKKLGELMHLVAAEKITPPLVHIVGNLSVESVTKAHSLLENNQSNGKKIVMAINSSD